MKTALVFGGALFATAAAASGIAYVLTSQPSAVDSAALSNQSASSEPTQTGATPGSSTQVADLRDDLARLTVTVRNLQAEVESLRSAATRETMSAVPAVGAVEPQAISREQLEQSVRDVLAAEDQRKAQQAETERIERDRQAATRMAERVGAQLSLAPADTTRLATHLIAAQDKRNILMQQMRDSGFDRDAMRSSFEELRTWNNNELVRLFGADVGGQIAEQTNNMGGRGGFGGGQGFGGPGDRGGRQQAQVLRFEGGG
jgi:hypothetical protein